MNSRDAKNEVLRRELARLAKLTIGSSAISFVLVFVSLVFFLESEVIYRTGTASGWYVSLMGELSANFV